MRRNRRIVLPLMLAASIIAAIVFFFLPRPTSVTNGFINDALSDHEEPAFAALSDAMQGIVKSRCPNGKVTGCINNLVSPEWGQLRETHFAIGITISDSSNAELYHTFWSSLSNPVSIVLITEEKNGRKVINGWRGFVLSEGEDADSDLVRGERHDNELFPP